MVRRALLLAPLVALALTATSDANHAWGNYHWARQSNSFTLQAGDNVGSVWDSHLALAAEDWSLSSVLDVTVVPRGTRSKNCRPTAGRIEVCADRYGNNGWLGLAQIWVSGSHITQAVAKMNDYYFNSPTYNTWSWRQLVMCQEIAHDFGLDHQDENFNNTNLGSCMDYTSNPAGNERPNGHDYDQLESIYGHTDSTTTVGSALPNRMPPAMGQIDFDTPAQWGRLVRSSRNGRVQIYELDFGRGHKVVTHVFWADPEGDARGNR